MGIDFRGDAVLILVSAVTHPPGVVWGAVEFPLGSNGFRETTSPNGGFLVRLDRVGWVRCPVIGWIGYEFGFLSEGKNREKVPRGKLNGAVGC